MTEGALRGPRYRRVFPDINLSADVELTLAVRSHAAFLLVEPSGGVLSGYSAAEWLGRSCGPARAPAEVLVPGRFRARPGLSVRRGTTGHDERNRADPTATPGRRFDGGPIVTTPLHTAWDLARRLDLTEAVVAVDAMARRLDRRRPGFEPAELLRLRTLRPGARGCRALDGVVALADPRAESPMETRLRLLLVRSGLPAPHLQYSLLDDRGESLARFDLAYPEAKLAIEYDGEDHDDALDRAGRANRGPRLAHDAAAAPRRRRRPGPHRRRGPRHPGPASPPDRGRAAQDRRHLMIGRRSCAVRWTARGQWRRRRE